MKFLLLLLFLVLLPVSPAQIATWQPNTEPDLFCYHLYYGEKPGVYSGRHSVHPHLNVVALGSLRLPPGIYYLALTAANLAALESDPTPELIWTNWPCAMLSIQTSTNLTDWTTLPGSNLAITLSNRQQYFRVVLQQN